MNIEERTEREDRTDLELAVEVLLKIQRDIGNTKSLLAGRNLPGLNFSGNEFNGANFSYANLDEAIFSHALLNGASFQGAKLNRARMDNATLDKVDFAGVELTRADLSRTQLNYTELSNATLDMASLYNARLNEAIFNNTKLHGTDFSGVNLDGAIALTQEQINFIIYVRNYPPRNIPPGLNLLESRAYVFDETLGGVRRFIKYDKHNKSYNEPWSGQPVYEWVEKEIEEREATA